MRWDLLFDDLESQLDQEQRDEERALALEEERLRISRLVLRDRLSALARTDSDSTPAIIRIELMSGRVLPVRPHLFGRDWMSATIVDAVGVREQCVIPLAAIAAVLPTERQIETSLIAVPEATGRLAERIGLPFVLRDLSRRRAPVFVSTSTGVIHGTIDRVARDHLDLAAHQPGSPRRANEVTGFRLIPLERVQLVSFR